MKVTLLLFALLVSALSVLLYGAVALVQKKWMFMTAPKDIQEAVQEHEERFPGARILGWIIIIFSVFLFGFAFYYAGKDGIENNFSFWDFFVRFLIMLYLWKAFDIICLDWYLLTKSHFFQHYYPETEGCEGYHSFGFNRKGQMIRIIIFPFVSLLLAWVCTKMK